MESTHTLDVDLWSTRVPISDRRIVDYESTLASDEKERATRFRFDQDRHRFVVGRGFLRCVLGQYLNLQPRDVVLTSEPGGKPRLDSLSEKASLSFSLSRSGETVLVGVVVDRAIGVDIEQVKPLSDMASLAQTAFSKHEFTQWSSMSSEQQLSAFYTAWTRKEALGKAAGRGISDGPDTIAVPIESLPPGRWTPIAYGPIHTDWMISGLSLGPDMMGCLAVQSLRGDRFTDRFEDISVNPTDGPGERPRWRGDLDVPPDAQLVIRRFRSPDAS